MTNRMKMEKLVRGEKVPGGMALVSDKADSEEKAADCGPAPFEHTV